MKATITYQPGKGVSFGNKELSWNTPREEVRLLLGEKFESGDNLIDLSQHHDGDKSKNIIQRRDIYKSYQGQDCFFFLNYDINDQLREIEIHNGVEININSTRIDFSMQIEEVANDLNGLTDDLTQLEEGTYFSEKLKFVVSSDQACGGDEDVLGYFYCSRDVSHIVSSSL